MSIAGKIVLSCVVVVGSILVIKHGESAFTPALPKDMPSNASFVATGYDLAHNEKKGEWIACSSNVDQGTDQCRVTDVHGLVIYQGNFLPVNGTGAVPASQLQVATARKADMWVQGPSEAGPVPVIPLANGEVLVPSDDAYTLATRWNKNPDELQRLSSEN